MLAISVMVGTRDAHTRTIVLAPYSRTLRTKYEKYGVRGTKSTVLVRYGFLVRETADFPSTKYGEYRVRIVPCWWGTNLSTEYGCFVYEI